MEEGEKREVKERKRGRMEGEGEEKGCKERWY